MECGVVRAVRKDSYIIINDNIACLFSSHFSFLDIQKKNSQKKTIYNYLCTYDLYSPVLFWSVHIHYEGK
jgi:hypothetical protein